MTYLNKALVAVEKTKDSRQNKALITNEYNKSIDYYQRCIEVSKSIGSGYYLAERGAGRFQR